MTVLKIKITVADKKPVSDSVVIMFVIFCLAWVLSLQLIHGADIDESVAGAASSTQRNIIMILLDDLGRSDIGLFGAEWDTPNIDAFIQDSITLSHHYVGYVCSTSRSQFLTGRYSFHMGYGEFNVFDNEKMGAVPQGSPTIAEYLKYFSNYQTYSIGKWHLGSPTYSNIASSRGFDYFFGYNGGMEDYRGKSRSCSLGTFTDFWENDEPYIDEYGEDSDAFEEYSTDLYMTKLLSLIDENHVNVDDNDNKPFFAYLGFQAIHKPFSQDTKYYDRCKERYDDLMKGFSNRIGVCEAILGVDHQLGKFIEYFQSSKKAQKVWDNTVIILTSDNGGSLDSASCNYPLRGGKNTFYEGNEKVVAIGMHIWDPCTHNACGFIVFLFFFRFLCVSLLFFLCCMG